MRHTFHQKLEWGDKRNTVGEVKIGGKLIDFSIPADLDGPGKGTNPDELLLSSAAGCYIMTLAAMLERSSIQLEKIQLSSELDVEVEEGIFSVKEIRHYPVLKGFPAAKRKLVERLVHKADERCMISNALKKSVSIVISATFEESEHHE